MPAASAKKRARQHANKLLQKESAPPAFVPPAKTVEFTLLPPLPSPATAVNNSPQPPVPTVTAIDFELFLQRTTSRDLEEFLELAATTQEGQNLGLLWR